MSSFEKNKNIWSDIYKSGKSNLSYPNENLVRCLHYFYAGQDLSNLKVLDYGFGSGNNLKHLYNMGFDVYGTEISDDAKKITLEKLDKEFNQDNLFLMTQEGVLPYNTHSFDLIVAWQVLYYNSFESFNKVLHTINTLLKPNGRFIGTMVRSGDIAITNSFATTSYERVINDNINNQAGSTIVYLPNEKDIESVFSMFDNLNIGYFETKLNNSISSHWVISGNKK